MNIIDYNTEHLHLTRQLDGILLQKKTRELRLREKYQSTKDDPSPIFYQIMAEKIGRIGL